MAANLIFPGRRPDIRESVMDTLRKYLAANADHDIAVTAKRHVKQRTLDQNAALFAVAYPPLRDHTGSTVDELHQFMCGEYFGWVEFELFGRTQWRPRRSTTADDAGRRAVLSRAEFAAFFEFVRQRGAEVGVLIPDPDPFWREAKEAA